MVRVFLSHNSADKPFALMLKKRLEAHGFGVWLDVYETFVGDSLIEKITTALDKCDYLAVILSPNSVGSTWVQKEVNIALTKEIAGKRIKVLPLLYKKCKIPTFLTDKLYADFSIDFDEGFQRLLDKLKADLQHKNYKLKRVKELIQQAYQDWLTFSRSSTHLLKEEVALIVFESLGTFEISQEIQSFIAANIAHATNNQALTIKEGSTFISKLVEPEDALRSALDSFDSKIVLGALNIIEDLNFIGLASYLFEKYNSAMELSIRRRLLRVGLSLKDTVPEKISMEIIKKEKDWVIQSYALRNNNLCKSCLLISDGTQFAKELGDLASKYGWHLVVCKTTLTSLIESQFNFEIFRPYSLIILVRGEHYSQYGNELFYSSLREYVGTGGTLFATSWTSWETAFNMKFQSILPFAHVGDAFDESIQIDCVPCKNSLLVNEHKEEISFIASYEILRPKENSTLLLESKKGIPILGVRKFGKGMCWYFNCCQHSCIGDILSPLSRSELLSQFISDVFKKIWEKGKSTPDY